MALTWNFDRGTLLFHTVITWVVKLRIQLTRPNPHSSFPSLDGSEGSAAKCRSVTTCGLFKVMVRGIPRPHVRVNAATRAGL
jgi:hypothetical protein